MARTNKVRYLHGLKSLADGQNRTQLAEALDIDYSTLYLLIECQRGASLDMALRIAEHFSTTVESLCRQPELVVA